MNTSQKTRILILGGGFGGLYAALHLEKTIAADRLTVTGRNRPTMTDAKLRVASCSQEAEQLQL